MNFLVDESVDRQIVDRLRQDGHHVWYVAEMEPGISDDAVLDLANHEMALLLTADKDFGELVFRQHRLAPGVVLIRLAGLSPRSKAEVVASAINEHALQLPRAFMVIAPGAIRIRRQST
jgi:predicted nuclease of predicted toxin-antitoxin system